MRASNGKPALLRPNPCACEGSGSLQTWDDVYVFYWVVKYTLGIVLKVVFRPWSRGRANVPRRGPVILASNHLSFSDHFFGPLPLPRKVIFLAKAEYFTGRGIKGLVSRAFFSSAGQLTISVSGSGAWCAGRRG